MALKIPYTRDTFSSDMKSRLSGVNVNLEFDNIESSLQKTGVEISKLIGKTLYDKLCDGTAAGSDEAVLNASAKDLLQRVMIHLSVSEHIIFLIARIGNDGVTVKKNDDETTIFRYQEEKLQNKLINGAWFWMNELIELMNSNVEKFTDWKESDAKKEYDLIPVKAADFKKWIGVSDEYFMLCASGIIREVWTDCVLSRKKAPEKTDRIARAVCYEVISRATIRLSYYCLPEPIRLDINNEMGKDHASQSDTYIREKVSEQFRTKAEAYWSAVEREIYAQDQQTIDNHASPEMYVPGSVGQGDKFCCS